LQNTVQLGGQPDATVNWLLGDGPMKIRKVPAGWLDAPPKSTDVRAGKRRDSKSKDSAKAA
jgi:hypothetical protein